MSPMKLPPAKSSTSTQYDHTNDPWFKNRFSAQEDEKALAAKEYHVPPYLKRDGYKPRKPEDFGDGGAFPEIHIAQYPLGMGRDKTPSSKILPVTVDSKGNVAFDNIVKQNENASKIVYSQHRDLVPKILRGEESDSEEESDELQKEIEETTEATKAAIEKIVNVRLSAAQPKNVPKHSSDSKFIKYKPSQQAQAFNSGAKERIIRMVEMPVDPLEPPKFKHKRVPRASGSPPVPVMHSPPRPVTVKDQQDWKIPPCISNWKNPKGYTIPLDKRLAADGRGLQDVQINDNFAKLSESLYVAEQKAREAVAMRSKVQKEMAMKEKEKKEMELRALAAKARSERTGIAAPVAAPARNMDMDDDDMRSDYVGRGEREVTREAKEEREERLGREKIREERRRERERERRLEAKDAATGKKSKITRDRDRDISEKVALGMASVGSGRGEVMYDQRLFNQEKGMESGFAADDQYNVYDKGLFTAQATLSTLYQPKKDMDNEMYGGADEQLEKIRNTERFKPDKGFTGTAEKSGKRERPVEFEQVAEEADPFGLDQFLTEVKKGKKAMDKIGGGGTMKASAGSTREGYDGGSGRSRIDFDKGGESYYTPLTALARERGGSRYCHYGNCLPCGLPCGEEYPFGHACKLRCHGPRPPPNPEFTLKPKKKKHNFQSEPTAGTPCPPCPELVWRFCLGQHFAAERMMVCSNKAQFSCDNLCGNPLACGNDYCTKPCHALQNLSSSLDRRTRGVPCEDCTLPCQKERTPACSHPCQQATAMPS